MCTTEVKGAAQGCGHRGRARARPAKRPWAGPCLVLASLAVGCQYDRADRWDDVAQALTCAPGGLRCAGVLQQCAATGDSAQWNVVDDCGARGLVCAPTLLKCTTCLPSQKFCDGNHVSMCAADGNSFSHTETCKGTASSVCREGSCMDLCAHAASVRSNVGCEYWGVDLDNAMIDPTSNAAGQQYAIVVSNPQPDLVAHVLIEQDDSLPGEVAKLSTVAESQVQPMNLRVFKLGPREVDGSPDGEFDTGTGTAITRHAYRITSQVPVVAYQFNPLDNVGVFSNDASLLKPVEALVGTPGSLLPAYVVLGWPQTIASTDDPNTNFNPSDPIDLRAFVTIVATRPNTHVRFVSTTRIIPGAGMKGTSLPYPGIPETQPGQSIDVTLQPFDVLNLESGGFNADFTGSLIDADQPVVVFSGSEASDAPKFDKLADRFCCADHLEEQIDPIRTAGMNFIAPHSPSRTRAVVEAGGDIAIADEPELFRVLAVSDVGPTLVSTTLPSPDDVFTLPGRGAYRDITVRHGDVAQTHTDFMLSSDRPVVLGNTNVSQDAAYVKRGYPGGDPSLIVVPPMEQYRTQYVFLTPDKYMFDFIAVAAPLDAYVVFDGNPITSYSCTVSAADGRTEKERGKPQPDFVVYRCQLSFPVIDPNLPAPYNVAAGDQNDGVHRLEADRPVMVLAYGFDNYVSYGYAAGTQLETIGPVR
ncbi:MAG: IgGFc-binding protein [Deltaproteobacteria bacterium]|nr:IgGFc-binding protein [Deltaproteobacteria bacterium]